MLEKLQNQQFAIDSNGFVFHSALEDICQEDTSTSKGEVIVVLFVCQELKISAGMSRLLPLSVSSSAFLRLM